MCIRDRAYADILTIEDSDFNSDINTASSVSKIEMCIRDRDNCIIHWLMMILTIVFAGYNVVRAVLRQKKNA